MLVQAACSGDLHMIVSRCSNAFGDWFMCHIMDVLMTHPSGPAVLQHVLPHDGGTLVSQHVMLRIAFSEAGVSLPGNVNAMYEGGKVGIRPYLCVCLSGMHVCACVCVYTAERAK